MNYNLNYHVSDDDYSFYGHKLNKFQANHPGNNFLVNQLEYYYTGSQFEAEQFIAEAISKKLSLTYRIQHFENNSFYIHFHSENREEVLMAFVRTARRQNFDGNIFGDKAGGTFIIRLSGIQPFIQTATEAIKQPPRFQATMKWYFKHDGRTDYRTIDIEQKHQVYDEMYPWIEGGINAYFKRYLESDANILILLGDPGTGKTTFIRELIVKNGLDAMITYEEELMMGSDRIYMDLITEDQDILILEDADLMLQSRDKDGNKIMSKLLNVSDGLMKNRKKIIFTGNITYNALQSADHALIRPGRCFDVQNFRSLTYDEAEKASNVMGIDMPTHKFNEITLAKLTNKDYVEPELAKIGFR